MASCASRRRPAACSPASSRIRLACEAAALTARPSHRISRSRCIRRGDRVHRARRPVAGSALDQRRTLPVRMGARRRRGDDPGDRSGALSGAARQRHRRITHRRRVARRRVGRRGGTRDWIYCALVAQDFTSGVLLAVNHSGDSDSTGSVCGNLLGALGGLTRSRRIGSNSSTWRTRSAGSATTRSTSPTTKHGRPRRLGRRGVGARLPALVANVLTS